MWMARHNSAPSRNRSTYSPSDMTYLRDALTERVGEFIQLRRDIHRHPELAFEEHRTSDLVAAKLEGWGYVVHRGLGGTGVVGTLTRGQGQRRLGLRADMDALPIQEGTGAEWSSLKPGVMHACGHDGHTAMLLAAAKLIAQGASFNGTVNLIFQPAEEGGGGAVRMMDDGLFVKHPCDAVFAMHNMPGIPTGHFVFRDGAAMASSDYVTVRVHGTGGHGAMPHRAADPLVAASSIVMALQTIVSRNVDPLDTAVVTVGALHAGQANNVIPALATLELSVRSLNPEVRRLLEQRIKALVAAQAESFGVSVDIDWRHGYCVLLNSKAETDFARQVALDLVGSERVTLQGPALTGSEDFAFMLEKIPGSYLLIGNGDGDSAGACMVHNPGYDFNDDNIATGAAYWVALVERFLAH
jgi:hippurate hydrolase